MHRSPHLPARRLLLLTALIAVSLPEQTSAQTSTQTMICNILRKKQIINPK